MRDDRLRESSVFGEPAADFVDVAESKKSAEQPRSSRGPLATIWFHPRTTMRKLLKTDPTYLVIPLAAAWGTNQFLGRAVARGLGDRMPTSAILAAAVLIAPLAGVASLYLFGWIWSWSGRRLGGRGDAQAVRAAIAWGMAPGLIMLVIQVGLLIDIGPELFRANRPRLGNSPDLRVYYSAMLLIRMFLDGYMIGLTLKCLAEAHRFSVWRAIGAVALGLLAFMAPFILLSVLLAIMS